MDKFKLRLVRGIAMTTECDMWQCEKHYRFRSGKYYGRVRYAEAQHG
jgi:uncharacterized Fe-S cluster-containing radical SAM superfamily protein